MVPAAGSAVVAVCAGLSYPPVRPVEMPSTLAPVVVMDGLPDATPCDDLDASDAAFAEASPVVNSADVVVTGFWEPVEKDATDVSGRVDAGVVADGAPTPAAARANRRRRRVSRWK